MSRRFSRVVFLGWALALFWLGSGGLAGAADKLAPFVLASEESGDLKQVVQSTKDALKGQGFDIAGEYSPYPGTQVIVVTNALLKKLAAEERGGAYLAGLRVSVTKAGDKVQVAYVNPEYFKYAYRVTKDVSPLTAKLKSALGAQTEFGSKGMPANKLKKYQYTFGMEYFDDEMPLKTYSSHKEAVDAIEKNLAGKAGGTSKVYRIDADGGTISVFGVALTDGSSGDKAIMEVVDFEQYKHSAHLPYELVVFDGKVEALHPRFRIAIDFPDLKMVGDNSFAKITRSPDAIRKALTLVAGGEWDDRQTSGFDVR
jgi:hypothetical protein